MWLLNGWSSLPRCALAAAAAAWLLVPSASAKGGAGDGGPFLDETDFPSALRLAVGLFNDGDYGEAAFEARRFAAFSPTGSVDYAAARTVETVANCLGGRPGVLHEIWQDAAVPLAARIQAAEILGIAGCGGDALLRAKALSFGNTDDRRRFWRAGALLYFLMKDDRALRDEAPLLWRQLLTCRDAWPVDVVRAMRKLARERKGGGGAPLPVRAVIAFYRGQISPAIGERCILEPSCSEYMLQACKAHGLLGVPIGMDRLTREPSVPVGESNAVARPDGTIRFADPVSDHDFWFK